MTPFPPGLYLVKVPGPRAFVRAFPSSWVAVTSLRIWQKTAKFCKAITLQLKNKQINFFKRGSWFLILQASVWLLGHQGTFSVPNQEPGPSEPSSRPSLRRHAQRHPIHRVGDCGLPTCLSRGKCLHRTPSPDVQRPSGLLLRIC